MTEHSKADPLGVVYGLDLSGHFGYNYQLTLDNWTVMLVYIQKNPDYQSKLVLINVKDRTNGLTRAYVEVPYLTLAQTLNKLSGDPAERYKLMFNLGLLVLVDKWRGSWASWCSL